MDAESESIVAAGASHEPVCDRRNLTFAQLEKLMQLQRDVLEMVALGEDTDVILQEICRLSEAIVPDSAASIMLFDEMHECLNVRAAPSIPNEGIMALNGLKPGPGAGSCGNAVYREQPVFVENTMTDPRWSGVRQVARDFGLCACWSMPIRICDGQVIGSFALSSFEVRPPEDFHRRILDTSSYLAGIVLQRQDQEQRLWRLAHYDTLTGLPNRLLFGDRLEHALAHAQRTREHLAVIYLDLDRFKNINDSLGHQTGDRLLCEVTGRLRSELRQEDSIARLGGDEFIVLLEDVKDATDAGQSAGRLLSLFDKPFQLGDRQYVITTSLGVAFYPGDGQDAQTLVKNADTAMYEAKARGRHQAVFYQPELTASVQSRMVMETELRQALTRGELRVHYQPQYDVVSGRIVGAEALVRWEHPEKGLIPPGHFISLAEDAGLIGELGAWVTETAAAQLKAWLDQGFSPLQLAINLSPKQLQAEFPERVAQMLAQSGLPARHLEFEITENLVMATGGEASGVLDTLKDFGVGLIMDDFGTGYSSLSQLKHLPIDKLKIDCSFVRNIPDDADNAAIARSIIALGHSLDLIVIAEGVETRDQEAFLKDLGCDVFQGFLYSRPVPAQDFAELLTAEADLTQPA